MKREGSRAYEWKVEGFRGKGCISLLRAGLGFRNSLGDGSW